MPRIGKGYARLHTIYFSTTTIMILLMWLFQSFIPVSASEVAPNDGIKLYVDDNLYYVKLNTLDSVLRGVVDTAATVPLIDSRALRNRSGDLKQKPAVKVLGSNGERTFKVFEVPQLRIGDVVLDDLGVVAAKLRQKKSYQVVLPSRSFEGQVVDFDFPNRVLRLHKSGTAPVDTGAAHTIGYSYHRDLPTIDIAINGVAGKAMLDTGAKFSYMNSAFAKQAEQKPNRKQQHFITGIGNQIETIYPTRVKTLKLGDFMHKRVVIMIADIDLFKSLKLNSEPAIVLGMDILKHYRVQIDRAQGEIRLWKPAVN